MPILSCPWIAEYMRRIHSAMIILFILKVDFDSEEECTSTKEPFKDMRIKCNLEFGTGA